VHGYKEDIARLGDGASMVVHQCATVIGNVRECTYDIITTLLSSVMCSVTLLRRLPYY